VNVHWADGRSTRLAAVALSTLLLGACQAAPPASTAGLATGPTRSAASGPTEPAAASPAPSSTEIAALEVSGSPGELAPGRYTRQGFEPRITFELDGPWHAVNAFSGFFDVQQDVGSPDVIAVQFGLPSEVDAGPRHATPMTTAEAAVETLKSNSRLVIVESGPSQIGGLTGFQVTVENPTAAAGDTPIMRVTPGVLNISPGRRLWCAFFDIPDGVLAIMVGGSVARWDEALLTAEPVLESVTIGQ